MATPAYPVEHWTTTLAEPNYQTKSAHVVTVNDRAATRQAIITAVRHNNFEFVERSDWAAHKNKIKQLGGRREFPRQQNLDKICPVNFGISLVNRLRNDLKISAP